MKTIYVLLLSLLSSFTLAAQTLEWKTISTEKSIIYYVDNDSSLIEFMTSTLNESVKKTELYFGKPFSAIINVYIFPSRNELDKQWQKDWGAPDFKSQCWMVASGVAKRLDILSLNTWKNEACEHDFTNKEKTAQVIFHELVHVYHAQKNPNPNFEGMDDEGWFVEGLATYVSGQLDAQRMKGLAEFVQSDKAPTSLSTFWSGKYKYGISGLMVKFIEMKYGKGVLIKMLSLKNREELLAELKTTESQLISDWKADLLGGK